MSPLPFFLLPGDDVGRIIVCVCIWFLWNQFDSVSCNNLRDRSALHTCMHIILYTQRYIIIIIRIYYTTIQEKSCRDGT